VLDSSEAVVGYVGFAGDRPNRSTHIYCVNS